MCGAVGWILPAPPGRALVFHAIIQENRLMHCSETCTALLSDLNILRSLSPFLTTTNPIFSPGRSILARPTRAIATVLRPRQNQAPYDIQRYGAHRPVPLTSHPNPTPLRPTSHRPYQERARPEVTGLRGLLAHNLAPVEFESSRSGPGDISRPRHSWTSSILGRSTPDDPDAL